MTMSGHLLVLKLPRMVLEMMGYTRRREWTAEVLTSIPMERSIRESSSTIRNMVKVFAFGPMGDDMRVNSGTIKWTATVFTTMSVERSTPDSLWMVKDMVRVFKLGLMENDTRQKVHSCSLFYAISKAHWQRQIDKIVEYFLGHFKNDKRNGKGSFHFANGQFFIGDFVDGKQHGQGVHTWPNGNRYETEGSMMLVIFCRYRSYLTARRRRDSWILPGAI